MYLKRKPNIVANECSFEIGKISNMKACMVKVVRPILSGTPCKGPNLPSFKWFFNQSKKKKIWTIYYLDPFFKV